MSEQCCPSCGAELRDARTCRHRLDVLLVKRFDVDAPEYGVAIAAFALQHPDAYGDVDIASAHMHLRLALEEGLDFGEILKRLRQKFGRDPDSAPPKPPVPEEWSYTIDDLEDGDGDDGLRLQAWARSVLRDLRAALPQ